MTFRQISSTTFVDSVCFRAGVVSGVPDLEVWSLKIKIEYKMATAAKMIKVGEEEVSERAVAKIRQEAERDVKKELFRQVVRQDYKCWVPQCQSLPRVN